QVHVIVERECILPLQNTLSVNAVSKTLVSETFSASIPMELPLLAPRSLRPFFKPALILETKTVEVFWALPFVSPRTFAFLTCLVGASYSSSSSSDGRARFLLFTEADEPARGPGSVVVLTLVADGIAAETGALLFECDVLS